MGPHCMNESDVKGVKLIQSLMIELAASGNFNGGDSNRHCVSTNNLSLFGFQMLSALLDPL